MAKRDLTAIQVTNEVKNRTEGERMLTDSRGLYLRIPAAGDARQPSWFLRYTLSGQRRKMCLGTYPDVSLAIARGLATELRGQVVQGIDPAAERKRTVLTVEGLFDLWQADYLSRKRKDGGKYVADLFRSRVFPEVGKVIAKAATRQELLDLCRKARDEGAGYLAGRLLSLIKQMYQWAVDTGELETNPVVGTRPTVVGEPSKRRRRTLSMAELSELRDGLAESDLPLQYRAAILLILATGARSGELRNARWQDFDKARAQWTIPPETAKNEHELVIPLSRFAMQQLAELEKNSRGAYVLSATGDAPLTKGTMSRLTREQIKGQISEGRRGSTKLALSGGHWTLHDLRRTCATQLGDLGVRPEVIEATLNHQKRGIEAVYQLQQYLPERRAALDKWGRRLEGVFNKEKAGAKVVALPVQASA